MTDQGNLFWIPESSCLKSHNSKGGRTMQFKHKLPYIALGGVLVIAGLLGNTSISLAQGDTWTFKTPMPTGRSFTSGAGVDGKIYVIGGFSSLYSLTTANEMYDHTTDQWTMMEDMPQGRCAHATCVYHGKIYVFGGLSPSPYGSSNKNVYEYDPQTNIWTEKADMPYANAGCGIAVVEDTIYLIGGSLSASSPPNSTVMAYNPVAESWTQKADMPKARCGLSACVVDGKIYAIGGTTENWQVVFYKQVEVYDPSTDTWTRKSDMPTGRWNFGTCVVDGKIYAIGGWSGTGEVICPTNEVYDPIMDKWATKSPMQQKRHGAVVCSIGDKIYAIGGSYPNPQNPSVPVILSSVEEYDPASEPTNVEEGYEATAVPTGYALSQNYPNPFNPTTSIDFDLSKTSKVTLKIFNILGEEVATLVSDMLTAGSYSYEWSRPAGIASGVYLFRLEAGEFVETKKMILMR
jgi:N-acetylneuraminic acid mutarotase